MDYRFEISKRLSREHQDVAALLAHLEKCLNTYALDRQPDWMNPEFRRLLGDLRAALRTGIPNHFSIEEEELFPFYTEEGGADMVELLLDDHRVILDLVREISPLVEKALSSQEGLAQSEWRTFRARCNVFITELLAHAEKEESGFVPAVDELLESATARRIMDRYLEM